LCFVSVSFLTLQGPLFQRDTNIYFDITISYFLIFKMLLFLFFKIPLLLIITFVTSSSGITTKRNEIWRNETKSVNWEAKRNETKRNEIIQWIQKKNSSTSAFVEAICSNISKTLLCNTFKWTQIEYFVNLQCQINILICPSIMIKLILILIFGVRSFNEFKKKKILDVRVRWSYMFEYI
jgi:hypothetical protein